MYIHDYEDGEGNKLQCICGDADNTHKIVNGKIVKKTAAELKADRKPEIQAKRASEYPPMTDYIDAVVKGDTVAQKAYIDACLAVKQANPFV